MEKFLKRIAILSVALVGNILALPALSFAGDMAVVHRTSAAGLKLVSLKADPPTNYAAAYIKTLAGREDPELLDTLTRLEWPGGVIPGNILLVVQNGLAGPQQVRNVEMVHVQPDLSAVDVYRVSPSPNPETYKPGLVWSRYARVNGSGVLRDLQKYAKEIMPTKGLDGLFEHIVHEHSAPLAPDFVPEPEQIFYERVVGISGRLITILKPGQTVTFQMGSPEGEGGRFTDEKQHEVTLTEAHKMQATLATWRQVLAVMPELKNRFDSLRRAGLSGLDYAAVNVWYYEALEFASRVSKISGRRYRLPTEAEWENAARAGTPSWFMYSSGNDARQLAKYAVYSANSNGQTNPVGLERANPWGLRMIGNAWQWASDWYGSYPNEAVTNPKGAAAGTYRVFRGGSWLNDAVLLRSANRLDDPGRRDIPIGVRLVEESIP